MITGWEVVNVDENQERREHMHQAVDDSVAGYYRLDMEGKFLDVNAAWLDMYKCKDRNSIIGKHYSLVRDKENIKELDEIIKKVFQGESITAVPAIRRCMDGSQGKHILSVNPVIKEGKITGMEGFILDITNLEKEV